MILTYRYRIKDASDSTRGALRRQARSVNLVWNYCWPRLVLLGNERRGLVIFAAAGA
jgi:hypothetical protein